MQIQINDRRPRTALTRGSTAVLLFACVVGCSGSDVTGLLGAGELHEEPGIAPALAAPSGAEGLTLSINTSEQLAGTFSSGSVTLSFELLRADGGHALDVARSTGEPLLRLRLGPDGERLELAELLTLEGPPGSLVSGAEPAREQLSISGDLALAAEFEQSSEFAALQALSRTLEEHPGIDQRLLPRMPALVPAAQLEEESSPVFPNGGELGIHRQALINECVVCYTSCFATLATCVAATGGIFSFVCVPFYFSCRDGCARLAACR